MSKRCDDVEDLEPPLKKHRPSKIYLEALYWHIVEPLFTKYIRYGLQMLAVFRNEYPSNSPKKCLLNTDSCRRGYQ